MNVGIIAACLPTLKPLVSSFYGVVSAITSGERYGSRYGSRHGTNVRSRPYVSNGYLKQLDRDGTHLYVMGEMKSSGARTTAEIPLEKQSFAEGAERHSNSAAERDESILPQHNGIMRTTEVRIS